MRDGLREKKKKTTTTTTKRNRIARTIKLICANILSCQKNTIYRETERKENGLIFLDLNMIIYFIYIAFNTLHVALRYLLLTFSITEHCINLLQVFLLPRPIIALPSSRAFCMFSKRSFILEFRESFQVSNSSRQELSWSSSWSNASYSEAKKEEMYVIDQARGQDGWLLVKFFFFFFIDWDEVEVNKDAKKKETISSHIDRISLVNKGFITIIIYGQ